MAVRTLDDLDPEGLAVGVRIDVNGPLDGRGRPVGTPRFEAHRATLEELLEGGARVALLAHQGRPGGDDFEPLAAHADRLCDLLGVEVGYVDAVCSHAARQAVRDLDDGEIACLENVRFYSEEPMQLAPERAAETHLVERLARVLDVYVNDAFAVAHRSQPSVVGFPRRLPSVAGRLLVREVEALGDLAATPTPRAAVLGGAKVDDSLDVLERFLGDDLADEVYVGGLVGNAFLVAAGADPGPATLADLDDRGLEPAVDAARRALERFGERIRVPVDVAVDRGDERREVAVEDFPLGGDGVPRDVGAATVERWRPRLADAGTVVVNGPLGLVEDPRFEAGTRAVFDAAAAADRSIAGGGDTATTIRRLGIDGFDHVSTGGGAAIALLSGARLPAIEALDACAIELPT
ncbi:MAG: phosphoglycerate kinase [Halobacteriales archaeon]